MKNKIKNRRLAIVGGKHVKREKLIAELLNKTFPEQWNIPIEFSYSDPKRGKTNECRY